MNQQEKTERHFELILEDLSKKRDYSQQRIDYITILVATLGIFQVTQIVGEIKSPYCDCSTIFMIPLFLFSISIIFNLTAQYLSLSIHKKAISVFKKYNYTLKFDIDNYEPEQLAKDQKPLTENNELLLWLQRLSIISICAAIILSFVSYLVLT